MANKENEKACTQDMDQEIFYMEPLEFPPNVNNSYETGGTSSKHTEYLTLTEVRHVISLHYKTMYLFFVRGMLCYSMIY